MRFSKKQKDIIYLLDYNLSIIGGAQESTKILLNYFHKELKIGLIQPGLTMKSDRKWSLNEFPKANNLKDIFLNPYLIFSYIVYLYKTIKKFNPKIIHTQGQASLFLIITLKHLLILRKDIILVHTERGLFVKYNYLVRFVLLFCLHSIDYLVLTTNLNYQAWTRFLSKRKCVVIENTAGNCFEKDLKPKDRSKLTIGFAGRYCNWKDWPLAFKIIEEVIQKFEDKIKVKLAIASSKKTEINEIENKVSNLLNNKCCDIELEFNIDNHELVKWYDSVDIYILTSKPNSESFGRTIIEAMNRHTVVLTTKSGGPVEVVNNDKNVCDNCESFVVRISYYYHNLNSLEKDKLYCLRRVKAKYSVKNNYIKHRHLYNNIFINTV